MHLDDARLGVIWRHEILPYIEDHFFDGRFHDVYIRFRGPVTAQLQAIFLASFAYHGGDLTPDDVEAWFHLGDLSTTLELGIANYRRAAAEERAATFFPTALASRYLALFSAKS